MKRIVMVLFVILMSIILIVGCTSDNGESTGNTNEGNSTGNTNEGGSETPVPDNVNLEGFPIVDEKITLTMMGRRKANQGPWEEMLFFNEMEKLTNIHFEFDTPGAQDYDNKKNIAFASGDYADVFFGGLLTPSDEVIYGAQGIFIPLEDLIEQYAPNFKKMMEADPDIKKSITAPDGHIYALPRYKGDPSVMVSPVYMNGPWMEAVGVTELPETTDDLYELLKKFKTGDPNGNGEPDEIPLSGKGMENGQLATNLLNAFGFADMKIDVIDGKVVYVPIQEGYKGYLKYMNKLYEEELLDNEIFSHTQQEFRAKGKSIGFGVFKDFAAFAALGFDQAESRDYPALPPLTSEYTDKKMVYKRYPVETGAFAITNKNEHPEASMRWADHVYSSDAEYLLTIGQEGVHWKWDADKTGFEILEKKPDNPGGQPIPQHMSLEFRELNDKGDVRRTFRSEIGMEQDKYTRDQYPPVYFTEEEQKQLNTITVDMDTFVDQMLAKFITGQESLDQWDDYVATIEKMNVEKLIEIHETALERWNK